MGAALDIILLFMCDEEKSFITLTTGVNVMKPFFLSVVPRLALKQ
jgi:hypothetical protein